MDAQHEDHLRRILEKRRARGALLNNDIDERPSPHPAPPPASPKRASSYEPQPQFQSQQSAPAQQAQSTYRDAAFLDRMRNVIKDAPVNPVVAARTPSITERSPDAQDEETTSGASDPLFKKGVFDNFRNRPVLVAPSIKPYRREEGPPASQRGVIILSDGEPMHSARAPRFANGGEIAAPRTSAGRSWDASPIRSQAPVTKTNPFRAQDFDEFVHSGEADGLENEENRLVVAANRGSVSLSATTGAPRARLLSAHVKRNIPLQRPFDAVVDQSDKGAIVAASSGVDNRAAIDQLMAGDWFIKNTRHNDAANNRFFWLDGRGMLYWAKTPHASPFLSSSCKVEDIVDVIPDTAKDPNGRLLHVISIWTTSRAIHIATENQRKCDVWFAGLRAATNRLREHNQLYYARTSTMRPMKHHVAPRKGAEILASD